MDWKQAEEPGVLQRLKKIAQLMEQLRRDLLTQDLRRIERMAQAARYFQGAER